MRAPRSPAQPKTTRLPNKARRLPQTKKPRSLVGAIPAAPELNEANMQSLTEATHAGNPALLASKPLRRALRLQAKSPAAPGARTLRCHQTKPSPRRPLLRILSSFLPRISRMRSNGEVEGPDDHARQAPRAHTVPRRPRRQTPHASRPPPTIVRRHRSHSVTEIANNPLPPSARVRHSGP